MDRAVKLTFQLPDLGPEPSAMIVIIDSLFLGSGNGIGVATEGLGISVESRNLVTPFSRGRSGQSKVSRDVRMCYSHARIQAIVD